jgi:hypothetical protein
MRNHDPSAQFDSPGAGSRRQLATHFEAMEGRKV